MLRLQGVELDFGLTEDGRRKTEHGWTDGRGSQNSYLDIVKLMKILFFFKCEANEVSFRSKL